MIDAVRRGRAQVNGKTCCDPAAKVDPEQDEVRFDGVVQSYQKHRYLMMNKPAGVITAVSDRRETVVDLLPEGERRGLFPVGRLDRDTEGLLLLTTDGQLCHALMSPRRHVEKVYLARVSGGLAPDAAARFAEGMQLRDGTACRPARLEPSGQEDGKPLWSITLRDGKNHQVKRIVACGSAAAGVRGDAGAAAGPAARQLAGADSGGAHAAARAHRRGFRPARRVNGLLCDPLVKNGPVYAGNPMKKFSQ